MAVNPFFSKKQIYELAPDIQKRMSGLCEDLSEAYLGQDRLLSLTDMWMAFAADNIFDYTFAWNYNYLGYEDYINPFLTSSTKFGETVHVSAHFPWLLKGLLSIPDGIVGLIYPSMRPVLDFQKVSFGQHIVLAPLKCRRRSSLRSFG